MNNLRFSFDDLSNMLSLQKKVSGPISHSMGTFSTTILNDYSIYKNLDTGEIFNIKSWHIRKVDNSTLIHRELIVLELENTSAFYSSNLKNGPISVNNTNDVCNIDVNDYEYFIDSDSNLIFEPFQPQLCKIELQMTEDVKRLKKLENI